jgi:serine kinase of HPr protein (carbohydrate metabolism regulator)
MSAAVNVHGSGVVAGGSGILLRGPSGSGKSILALLLIAEMDGRLVADDRLDLVRDDGEVMMSPPEAIAGMIELRGRGLIQLPYERRAAVRLIVDLVPELIRMPEESSFVTDLMGLPLPRCPVPQAGIVPPMHQLLLIREGLRQLGKKTT